jgi:hypothetical protein
VIVREELVDLDEDFVRKSSRLVALAVCFGLLTRGNLVK